MKLYTNLFIVLLAGMLFLISSANSITVSVANNAGGFTEVIDARFDDRVFGSTTIGSDRLSNSIVGNADFKESHSVSNTAGATAEVGADIRNAEWYSYSYDLWPGQGSNWKAAKYPEVAASEDLDVLNASYIEAYADAFNSKGYRAGVSAVISDPGNEASLMGYSNLAMASKNEASASQTYDWASSPNGYIQADLSAEFTKMKSRPLRFVEDKAETGLRVDRGYVEGYSDLASAFAQGAATLQKIDAATGEEIQTGSMASYKSGSLFQGLGAERAGAYTQAEGSLTGYNASAESWDGNVFADQTGHVVGSFTGTALAGNAGETRNSNYGDTYNFAMYAGKDAFGYYASGDLGYYVDYFNPMANSIQGAVDAAESGDAINVGPGSYLENVQIDKSLDIRGAGAGETVVDGNQAGSVFIIGRNDPNVDVSLSRMGIQGGSGTYTQRWIDEPPVQCGGGIWNAGSLSLEDLVISDNAAIGYGAGIWSTGSLTVDKSFIHGNIMPRDGGGIWSSGDLIVIDSVIAGNEANWNGGGIWSSGGMLVEGSTFSGNSAGLYGGAIANDMGWADISNITIQENRANSGGGGIYNIFGIVYLEESSIIWNSGKQGGGILNNGVMNLNSVLIDNNTATENGGGICQSGGVLDLINISVSNNKAEKGGGICNSYGTVNMVSGSIDHNNATAPIPSGGGVYNLGILIGNTSIVHDNTPDQIVNSMDRLPET